LPANGYAAVRRVIKELSVIVPLKVPAVAIGAHIGEVDLARLKLQLRDGLAQLSLGSRMHGEIANRRRIRVEGRAGSEFCTLTHQANPESFADTPLLATASRPAEARNVRRPPHHDLASELYFRIRGGLGIRGFVLRSRDPEDGYFEFDQVVSQRDFLGRENGQSLTREVIMQLLKRPAVGVKVFLPTERSQVQAEIAGVRH